MDEKAEIIFMQTRLVRLASEEWHLPVEKIVELFKKVDVFGYIEKGHGIFHCVKVMRLSLMISQSFWKERGLKLMHDLSDGLIL